MSGGGTETVLEGVLAIPDGLRDESELAWRNAVRSLEELGRDPTLFVESIDLYARAVDRAVALRETWESVGCPVTTLGGATGSVEAAHPIVKMMESAEVHVARFAAMVGLDASPAQKRVGGRPVGAASAPDRRPEPARVTPARARRKSPQLKAVK